MNIIEQVSISALKRWKGYSILLVLCMVSWVVLLSCDIAKTGNKELTPPSNVLAKGGNGKNTISWDESKEATSYNIYWSTIRGRRITENKIEGVRSPYTHTGLKEDAPYYYVVTTVNNKGIESPASTEASAISLVAPSNVFIEGEKGENTISWDSTKRATSYNIYWSKVEGAGIGGTKIEGVKSPYTHTGLEEGTLYYYVVTALEDYYVVTAVGYVQVKEESLASREVSVITVAAPPSNVSGTGGKEENTISWSESKGATSYNLYWSKVEGAGTGGTKIEGVTSPYTHTGLEKGTLYYYVVTSVGYAEEESLASREVIATTAVAPPSNVLVKGGKEENTISWDTTKRATSYNIYWSKIEGTGTGGTKIEGAKNPYTHAGLKEDTLYYYVVTIVNVNGIESPASTEASAIPLIAPINVLIKSSNGENTISWATTKRATSYNIYWSITQGAGKNGTKIENAIPPYTHTGLEGNTTYYYVVTAVDEGEESLASTEASVKTKEEVFGLRDTNQDFTSATLKAAGNESPTDIWSDGTIMWVADYTDKKIYAYDFLTKERKAGKDITINIGPSRIWSNGETMWVSSTGSSVVEAYNIGTKNRDTTKDITVVHTGNEKGLWGDDDEKTFWIAEAYLADKRHGGTIYAYDIESKSKDTTNDFTIDSLYPLDIWSDGTTMWVSLYASAIESYDWSDRTNPQKNTDKKLTLDFRPRGIWSDGKQSTPTMWIVKKTSEESAIYAYRLYGYLVDTTEQ